MKWLEILALVASVSALIQFTKFVLDSLTGKTLGDQLTLLLATIFVLLMVILLLIYQIKEETRKMKEFLKLKGFKENESLMEKLFNQANKKGMIDIDPRVLLAILIAVFLYLIYKAFFA